MKPACEGGFFSLQKSYFIVHKKAKITRSFLLFVLRTKYYFLSFEFIKAATTVAPIIGASEPMILEAFLTVEVVAINEDASLICSKFTDLFSDTAYFLIHQKNLATTLLYQLCLDLSFLNFQFQNLLRYVMQYNGV